jgi:Cyclin M transmembrane N-terminal domain
MCLQLSDTCCSALRVCLNHCSFDHSEILPSAFFTGPNQLRIAASLSYVVWGLMAVLSPIAWPIAKGLDLMLGTEVSNCH